MTLNPDSRAPYLVHFRNAPPLRNVPQCIVYLFSIHLANVFRAKYCLHIFLTCRHYEQICYRCCYCLFMLRLTVTKFGDSFMMRVHCSDRAAQISCISGLRDVSLSTWADIHKSMCLDICTLRFVVPAVK